MKFLYAITSDSRPSEVKVGYYYGEIIDMLKEYDNVNLLHYIETDDYSFTLMLINKFLNVTCDKDFWYKCDSKVMKNILLRVSTEIDRLNNSIKNVIPKDRIFKSCDKRGGWEYIEEEFMKTIDWKNCDYIITKKKLASYFVDYCNYNNLRIKDLSCCFLLQKDDFKNKELIHGKYYGYIEKYKILKDDFNYYYCPNDIIDIVNIEFQRKILKDFILDECISILNAKKFSIRYSGYLIQKEICPILAYTLDKKPENYDKIFEVTTTYLGSYYQSLIEL